MTCNFRSHSPHRSPNRPRMAYINKLRLLSLHWRLRAWDKHSSLILLYRAYMWLRTRSSCSDAFRLRVPTTATVAKTRRSALRPRSFQCCHRDDTAAKSLSNAIAPDCVLRLIGRLSWSGDIQSPDIASSIVDQDQTVRGWLHGILQMCQVWFDRLHSGIQQISPKRPSHTFFRLISRARDRPKRISGESSK
jgi:hypothetical protein